MLSLTRPSPARVEQLIASQANAPLTYDAVGSTWGELPAGWMTDDQRRVIGHGEADYRAAVDALRRWKQFDLDWVWPVRFDVPVREGEVFAFLAWSLGVWSVNVCRVVAVVDESDERGARFGFAYGTVGAHSVRGEERFMVQWDRTSDEVEFGIRKFSKPASTLLAVLGPLTRRVQARFTRQALARLEAEVRS